MLRSVAAVMFSLACVTSASAATPEPRPNVVSFELDKQRVYVVMPSHPLGAEVDVFVYLHGLDGYYWKKGKDNALDATGLATAIQATRRDVIAVLPEARKGDADTRVALLRVINKPGGLERVLDQALAEVARKTGRAAPRVRAIGIGAHSGGGGMIGPAIAGAGRYANAIRDVSLMDAGYAYKTSFERLRAWLLVAPSGKTLRIFHGGDRDAAFAVKFFSREKVTPFFQGALMTLSPETLGRVEVQGMPFDLLELTRAEHQPDMIHARFGAALGEGHWKIRDATLPAAATSIGDGPEAWHLR